MSTLNEGSVLVSEDYFKKLFAEDNEYTSRVIVIDSAEPVRQLNILKTLVLMV